LLPLLDVAQGHGFGRIAEAGAGLRQLSPSPPRGVRMPAAARRREFVHFGERLTRRSVSGDRSRREFRSYKVQANNNNRNPRQAQEQQLATLYRATRRELATRKSACSDE
jgi:hypothetical protein